MGKRTSTYTKGEERELLAAVDKLSKDAPDDTRDTVPRLQHDATIDEARRILASEPPPPPPPPPPPVGIRPPAIVDPLCGPLLWDEAFPDLGAWNVQNNSTFGDGNAEEQRYMASNVATIDGILRLTAQREASQGKEYTSGMVTTRAQGGKQRFAFTHGYFEVKARWSAGGGLWPAAWLVGAEGGSSWPAYGEIDVFEGYGTYPESVETTFHWSKDGKHAQEGGQAHKLHGGKTSEWHDYGVLWTPDRLVFIIDGEEVQTFVAKDDGARRALQEKHTIILNLAIGGNGPRKYHGWDGKWEDGDLPAALEFDHVRVWSLK